MTAAESLHHSLAESRALLGMGAQIVGAGPRLAPGVGAAIADATDTVIADLAAQSPQARRLIESQQAFAHLVNDVHLRPMA